jgi:hypothetical protein
MKVGSSLYDTNGASGGQTRGLAGKESVLTRIACRGNCRHEAIAYLFYMKTKVGDFHKSVMQML